MLRHVRALVPMVLAALIWPIVPAQSVIAASPQTVLYVDSQLGDGVGQGREYWLAEPDASVVATYGSGVLSLDVSTSEHWFHVDLAAPGGSELVPGTYLGATRYPFNDATDPGLAVYGNGIGCNENTGQFTVHEADFVGGTVDVFAATLQQFCDNSVGALYAHIRINSSVDLQALTVTPSPIDFGFVPTGTQSPAAIGITNVGSLSVQLGAAFIENASDFVIGEEGCSGAMLAPGDACEINVYFAPQAPGFAEALLRVPDDTLKQGRSIRLTGFGEFVPPPSPPNDDAVNALAIDGLPFSASPIMDSATIEGLEYLQCNGPWRTVWYSYVPDADGAILLSLSSTDFDASVQVFEDGDPIACHIGEGTRRVSVQAGRTYLLQVGNQVQPVVNLLVEEGPPPLDAAVGVGQIGIVGRGGEVTITGTVTCNQAAIAHISAQLRQRLTRTVLANGNGGVSVECGTEPVAFSLVVRDDDQAFSPGQAQASVSAFVVTDDGQFLDVPAIDQQIKLRR